MNWEKRAEEIFVMLEQANYTKEEIGQIADELKNLLAGRKLAGKIQ